MQRSGLPTSLHGEQGPYPGPGAHSMRTPHRQLLAPQALEGKGLLRLAAESWVQLNYACEDNPTHSTGGVPQKFGSFYLKHL